MSDVPEPLQVDLDQLTLQDDNELINFCQKVRVYTARRLIQSNDMKEVNTGLKALSDVSNTILRKQQNENEKSANDIAERALAVAARRRTLVVEISDEGEDSTLRIVEGRSKQYVPDFKPSAGLLDPVGTQLTYEQFTAEQEEPGQDSPQDL